MIHYSFKGFVQQLFTFSYCNRLTEQFDIMNWSSTNNITQNHTIIDEFKRKR